MTDRITALRALEKAVEAGEDRADWMPWIDPLDRTRGILPYKFCALPSAYNGSLDAAKALHERLLPGWAPSFGQNVHHGYWFAHVMKAENGAVIHDHSAQSDNPARAWLLAIIRALIAKEGGE